MKRVHQAGVAVPSVFVRCISFDFLLLFRVCAQCTTDADAIASGYGILAYLRAQAKNAPPIQKAICAKGLEAETLAPARLEDYARACVTKPDRRIRDRLLSRATKVITPWSDSCLIGLPGRTISRTSTSSKRIFFQKPVSRRQTAGRLCSLGPAKCAKSTEIC